MLGMALCTSAAADLVPRLQSRLVEHFVTCSKRRVPPAKARCVNVKTATKFFIRLHHLIGQQAAELSIVRAKWRQTRVTLAAFAKEGVGPVVHGEKVVVFGLLKRGGKVYTAIIPNAKTQTLLPIIEDKVMPDSHHRLRRCM
jgi:transposase